MLSNLKNDVTADVTMNPVSFELQSQEYFQTRLPTATSTPTRPLEHLMQSRLDERATLLPQTCFQDALKQSLNHSQKKDQARKQKALFKQSLMRKFKQTAEKISGTEERVNVTAFKDLKQTEPERVVSVSQRLHESQRQREPQFTVRAAVESLVRTGQPLKVKDCGFSYLKMRSGDTDACQREKLRPILHYGPAFSHFTEANFCSSTQEGRRAGIAQFCKENQAFEFEQAEMF